MTVKTTIMVASLILSVIIGVVIASQAGGGTRGAGGAGSAAGRKKAPVIGMSMDTLSEARWQADRDLFVKKAKELGAGEIKIQSANSDDTIQIRDVQTLLTGGVDVLVIVAHDGKAMARAVDLAHDSGVPVIAYDRLILNPALDVYLSFDNVRVGEEQAKYLVSAIGGKGNIVRVFGAPTDNNARLFKQGQDNILKPLIDKGDIKIVHEDWATDWKPEEAKKIVNAAITKVGRDNIKGIAAANDGTAGGAIQALSEEGIAGKIPVTGQDAELVACQRIVQGTQAMTVYKPLKNLATRAAEVAVALGQGRPVVANKTVPNGEKVETPSILQDVVVVTKDNMRDTVIKDGFHSEQEIYGGASPAPAPAGKAARSPAREPALAVSR
jgi:D-xylose transport system substrate-binding protein